MPARRREEMVVKLTSSGDLSSRSSYSNQDQDYFRSASLQCRAYDADITYKSNVLLQLLSVTLMSISTIL
jgi:hypothetical protein